MGKGADKVMLTKRIVETTKPDPTKRLFIYDAKVPGLTLCITPNQHRSFYLVRRIKGTSGGGWAFGQAEHRHLPRAFAGRG